MVLFGLILWACVSKKSEYERFVYEWQSKEILLPDVMTDVLTGDTIDLSDADFSIITYVDSTGCTSCKMKLSLWNVFLDRINQKSDANVKTVIVVNAKDKRDIVHLLKKFKYYHPVYIDADGSMNKINKFPSDPIFQSFLLDKSHRVIAVGNPVYLYSVDSLYQSILNGEKSLSHNVNSIMVVKNGTIDLGNIKSGQIISEKFYLSNSGNDTVNILNAISSCECVSVELSDSLILPNATISGMMEFESDSTKGVFSRNIHIFYKGFDYPSIINIIGKIN